MNHNSERAALISELRSQGIQDERVLDALNRVPRHLFVTEQNQAWAYENSALAIEKNQTISQPYIVALMTELLLQGKSLTKVLEIGTGSGYQAAVLAELVDEVYTIERIESLQQQAIQRFELLNYHNIHCRYGDGNLGWPEQAPFDGILVTAASSTIPEKLLKQLKSKARMIIPIGPLGEQHLQCITRRGDEFETQVITGVAFVPLLPGVRE